MVVSSDEGESRNVGLNKSFGLLSVLYRQAGRQTDRQTDRQSGGGGEIAFRDEEDAAGRGVVQDKHKVVQTKDERTHASTHTHTVHSFPHMQRRAIPVEGSQQKL